MHFASLAYVNESVKLPMLYYYNNVSGTIDLLAAMTKAGVYKIIFSSTCATYGISDEIPIAETAPQNPINPYGKSKLFIEQMLIDYGISNPKFGYCILRYFNVAGSAKDGTIGECHDPETHLIPIMLQTALGQREKVFIYGNDYDTPDGTCIRDYIYVEDLVDAHIKAMSIIGQGTNKICNLGMGRGHSVMEIMDAVNLVTNSKIKFKFDERRHGDPPCLYSNPRKARLEIDWYTKYNDINEIIETAWKWIKDNPNGYKQ